MNILVSSTRQWNPGDEFILMGVRNLFEEALGPGVRNWILYDRNPDLFVDGFSTHQRKETIWSNSYHHDSPECFDMALVAGTPEWMGRPLEDFYGAVTQFPFIYSSTPENIINDVVAYEPKNAEQLVH